MNEEELYDAWTDRVETSRRHWKRFAILLLVAVGVSKVNAQIGLVIAAVGGAVMLVAYLLNKYVTKRK